MNFNWKNIAKCAAFILIFCGLVGLLSLAAVKFQYPGVGKMQADFNDGILGEPRDSLDVIVVGDSECFSAVSPMEMWNEQGIASYVLSHPGRSVQMSLELLNYVLEEQDPDLVLLETNSIFIPTRLETWISSEVRAAVPGFANHEFWRKIQLSDLKPGKPGRYLNDMKGYNYSTEVDPWEGEAYMVPTEDRQPVQARNRRALDRIVRLCQQRDIELVLLSVPTSMYGSWPRHNTLQDYADENDLTYLDMNLITEDMGLDWLTDTRDRGDHMNYEGAAKVSRCLGQWLKENYELPDHRGEPGYGQWEISAGNYAEQLKLEGHGWGAKLREAPEK